MTRPTRCSPVTVDWIVETTLCTGGPCHVRVELRRGERRPVGAHRGRMRLPRRYDVSADARYVVGRRFGVYPTFECPEPNGSCAGTGPTKQLTGRPRPRQRRGTRHDLRTTVGSSRCSVPPASSRVATSRPEAIQVADTDCFGRRDTTADHTGPDQRERSVRRHRHRGAADPGRRQRIGRRVHPLRHRRPTVATTPATVARGASHVTVQVHGHRVPPGPTVTFPSGGVTVHSVDGREPEPARRRPLRRRRRHDRPGRRGGNTGRSAERTPCAPASPSADRARPLPAGRRSPSAARAVAICRAVRPGGRRLVAR